MSTPSSPVVSPHVTPPPRSPRLARRRRIVVSSLVATLALAVIAAVAAPASVAGWSDGERAAGAFTAGTVEPPTHLACASMALDEALSFTWTPPSGGLSQTEYRWTLASKSGVIAGSADDVDLPASVLGIILNGTFSMYAVGPGGWRSTPVTATVTTIETGILVKIVVVLSCVSHNP